MMKYLLLLIVLAFVSFLLGVKRARQPERRGDPSSAAPPVPPGPPKPKSIVSCAHCGLHLPQDEALPGRGGMFCGAAHRTAFEAVQGADGQRP